MNWQIKPFAQLSVYELYDLLKARSDVFVVEQTCIYSDMDDIDQDASTLHVFGYQAKELVGTCRILAPGKVYEDKVAIGRVLIVASKRNQGLATSIMQAAIERCRADWPKVPIKISAQQHLEAFYQSLGFQTVSDMYLEDDIPHIAMVLSE